ncbi:hypothetical protein [Lysinibacillus sp. RS5]|uniref:hypothetical protein n=1 Tax=unclassified Lysinibacillus TaxID=2636778 RepID=UPI0035BE6E7B
MGVKSKFGILILACAVIWIALFVFTQKEPYSTEAVMDSLWVKHNVQSTMIGDTDPVLEVSVFDEKDITVVESYLKNNLSKEDLEHYEINVFLFSENPSEYIKNAQKNRESNYK